MVTASHLEVARASATRTKATSTKSTRAAASGISTVIPGRCRCTASSVPAIVRSDDARNATFKVHVGGFHAFVGEGHADVCIILHVESLAGVDTIVVCCNRDCTARNGNRSVTVETVIAAVDVDNTCANGNARITLDALHAFARRAGTSAHAGESASHAATAASASGAGCGIAKAAVATACSHFDSRSLFFAVSNGDSVVRRNTVKCCGDGDFATRDFNRAFAFFQFSGVFCIALDAIATGRCDVDGAACNADRALAL